MAGDPETTSEIAPESAAPPPSRWDTLVWPHWLPLQSRLPLIAQITGAVALIAAVAMPRWTVVSDAPITAAAPLPTSAATMTEPAPVPPPRPAHLNLDVRHSFGSVDLSVSVDGERVLDTKLAGSRRRFGVVGKRAERSYTKTLDLASGARVVRVRVRSAEDEFDQTRVEQFDLGPATVATMRISADKAGLSVVADRPPAPAKPASVAAAIPLGAPAPRAVESQRAAESSEVAEASALAELYQTLRSTLIAMAGFIASAATGFLVESYLRSRRAFTFAQQAAAQEADVAERRRRRRAKQGSTPDIPAGAAG